MNHRSYFLVFGLLGSFVLHAQEQDTANVDSQINWLDDFGVYVGGYSETGYSNGSTLPSLSGEIGITYKKLRLGGFAVGYNGDHEEVIIFPNSYQLDYRYGGFILGYQLMEKGWFRGTASVRNGFGDSVWQDKETEEYIFRDKLTVIHPELELDISPISFFKLSIRAGYRWSSLIDISKLSNLSGMTFSIGVKIDYRYADQ